jgi:hypothetical protein
MSSQDAMFRNQLKSLLSSTQSLSQWGRSSRKLQRGKKSILGLQTNDKTRTLTENADGVVGKS